MRILKVSGLEVRWEVKPSQEFIYVTIVYISGMDVDKITYKCDLLTFEILEMSLVRNKSFIKGCHAVLRRLGYMEKKTFISGTGLFKKEVNRRFFTKEFIIEEGSNS
jgi:hypothetical protein